MSVGYQATPLATALTIVLEPCTPYWQRQIKHAFLPDPICEACPAGTYSPGHATDRCVPCPRLVTCLGGGRVDVDPGYFVVFDDVSETIHAAKCLTDDCLGAPRTVTAAAVIQRQSCRVTGNNTCTTRSDGQLCADCADGYVFDHTRRRCMRCPGCARRPTGAGGTVSALPFRTSVLLGAAVALMYFAFCAWLSLYYEVSHITTAPRQLAAIHVAMSRVRASRRYLFWPFMPTPWLSWSRAARLPCLQRLISPSTSYRGAVSRNGPGGSTSRCIWLRRCSS